MGAISADINLNASDGERDSSSPLQRVDAEERTEWTLEMVTLLARHAAPVARVEPAPPVTTPINLVGREGERD